MFAMTDQHRERCKKYLRSTLLSNKGGVPAPEVNKHYRDLVGEEIPYWQFKNKTLEDFLTSMPDVCHTYWSGRVLMVMGVANSATQHIEKMVSRQQNGKKGGKGGRSKQGSFPPRIGGRVGGNGLSAKPPRFGGDGSGFSAKPPRFGDAGAGCGSSSKPGSVFGRLGSKPLPYVEPRARPAAVPAKKTVTAPTSPRKKIDLNPTSVHVERACLETVGGKAVYGRRVQEQLQGRPHGMFSTQVEKVYQKKYEESLPKDWLQVMERAGMARVVRESGTSILVYPALFGESGQASLNNNLVSSITTRIPPVPLPTSSEWDITICRVTSTNQVHFWLGEAATKLNKLHDAMKSQHMYNDKLGSGISPPEIGQVYSALMGGDKARRVQVLKVDSSKNTCRCRMIDLGTEAIVNWNKLQKLDKTFYEVPAQAVKAILEGVHHQEGGDQVKFVEKYLEGRRLVGVVVNKETEDTPSMVLFDTSQEEDIMVNDEIIKHMNSISSTQSRPPPSSGNSTLTTPRLPGVGEYFDLVVSHVVSPSMFYVQSHSTLPNCQALNTQMTKYYDTNICNIAINNITLGSLFAVMHSNTWYRAELVTILSSSLCCMRLIDTGRMVMTVRDKMKPLVEQFKQLPIQAISAKLASVKPRMNGGWDEQAVEWLKHVALNRSLVGLVEGKVGKVLEFTLYDTSVEDVDFVINKEMLSIGLASKK